MRSGCRRRSSSHRCYHCCNINRRSGRWRSERTAVLPGLLHEVERVLAKHWVCPLRHSHDAMQGRLRLLELERGETQQRGVHRFTRLDPALWQASCRLRSKGTLVAHCAFRHRACHFGLWK